MAINPILRKLILILTILPVFISYAQKPESPTPMLPRLKVDNWQMDQGLPVNSIMSVVQTKDGWLFFGTEEGLVRFDGVNFLLMNKSTIPELTVNFISTLLGSRDTSLWIGTEGGGVLRFKNGSFSTYKKDNGLSDDRIFALCEDSSGGIWIGTSGSGLNYLKNGKVSRFDTSNGLSSNYIRAIAIDARQRVWVGTQKGLSVVDNGEIKFYDIHDGLSDDFIETLAFDKSQNLWIGTKSGGLNVLNQSGFNAFTMADGLTSNSVVSLCFDTNGMLWIGTNGGGITRMFDGKFYPFTMKEGLSGDLIVTLFEDRERNIWAGSSGTGIDRIKRKTIQTLSAKESLPGDVILPLFEDHSGILWLGVAGIGLSRLENGQVQTFTGKNGLPDYLVLTISEDLENTLWIGTAGGGLTSFKEKKFTTYTSSSGLSNNVVVAVFCDRSGSLWVGTTGGGINLFKNGEFSAFTTKDGLSDDNISCILEDRQGDLWVGTNDGLNRIRDNKITVINQEGGLSDDYILTLYEDKAGNLWVGTAGNGLNLIKDGKVTQFTVKDGLINEVVLAVLEDDFGDFWISCNKGIYKIKKQDLLDFADSKLKSLTCVSYGKSDGMESIECNGGVFPAGCKTSSGRLLFPTMKGVAIIDPSLLKTTNSDLSPIFIEEILVDGRQVTMAPPLFIPSYSRRLEFRYAALNYTNPEKIRYRCMLEGFDKDWIECDKRKIASYTNISGGNYTFKVMAATESGQWDQLGHAELKFHKKNPFYRSFAFYLTVVIVLALLAFLAGYYFLLRIQRNRLKLVVEEGTRELNDKIAAQIQTQEELQRMNSELITAKEQAESGDRLKTAFLNNISHEIRTPLNGILGFSSLITQSDVSLADRELFHSHLEASSTRLLNTINNYMDISLIVSGNLDANPKPFDLHSVFINLLDQFRPLCTAKNIDLLLEAPKVSGSEFFLFDGELLKKAFMHLLDNAVKFTHQGMITFGYSLKQGALELFVRDTGIGISQESLTLIFDSFMQEELSFTNGYEGSGLGLSIVQGIVRLLGGEISVKSQKGVGSEFIITLPSEKSGSETSTTESKDMNTAILKNPLVLVAEDDDSNRFLIEKILASVSVKVVIAINGKEAVEQCRNHPEISLVLMDIKMPLMDGLEATREIRSFRNDLPVIAITAFAMTGDKKRALEAGCHDYIAKPVDKEVLLEKLRKFGIGIRRDR